jgi:23S rRNA (adenine2030-N6)-methyltransferase
MFLFERHPAEHRALKRSFGNDRRVKVLREDGLTGCIGLVPPPERRALLLIDPSYELRDEHAQVIDAIVKTQQRFAACVMTVWYPVIERRWVERYERALRATGVGPLAIYELTVAPESASGGLVGSGMFVINAPWQLDRELTAALPWLAKRLGREGKGAFRALC